MRVRLPWEALAILQKLNTGGFSGFVVGGAVRDIILGRSTYDWDFTTNATPEQICSLFPENFYTNTFGTVGIARSHLWEQIGLDSTQLSASEKDQVLEITTFRSESAYSDFRRPDSVQWGNSLDGDLQRRDFTINSLALSVSDSTLATFHPSAQLSHLEVDCQLHDPFSGQADLQRRVLRTVGNPQQRFQEDALRLLRAVRFAAQLEMQIEPDTLVALQSCAPLVEKISWERIRDEMLKIIVTDHVEDALTLMYTAGILQYVLPELITTRGVEQRGHHEFDVWTHSLRACASCPSRDPVVRLATLLHDIAKPQTQTEIPDSTGEYSFYNHEVIGARLARDVARRLRLPKDDIQRIFLMVRWHMFYYQPNLTDAAIRRFIRRVGPEMIDDMMALREGDRVGSGSKRTSWRLEEMKQRIYDQLHQPLRLTDLVIKGEDVMQTLQIKPGKKVGDILQQLFEEVLEDPNKNNREYLLDRLNVLNTQS